MSRKKNQQKRLAAEARQREAAALRRVQAATADTLAAQQLRRLREAAKASREGIGHAIAAGRWHQLPAPVLDAWYCAGLPMHPNHAGRHRVVDLLRTLESSCPRLATAQWIAPLARLAEVKWRGRANEWKAPVRSPKGAFPALARHVLGPFRVPGSLIAGLEAEERVDAGRFADWAASVARGGSAREAAGRHLPVRLTRREVHQVLLAPRKHGGVGAIRRAQLTSAGAGPRLVCELVRTPTGRRLRDRGIEAGLPTTFGWLVRAELDRGEAARVLGWFVARRREDPTFSMAGRSRAAVLRRVARAEKELGAIADAPDQLPEAMFAGGTWQVEGTQWAVLQLRAPAEFIAESRAMEHCVYTYIDVAQRGKTSIWSLTRDGERAVTIEVDRGRRIVQVRGKHNRAATPAERSVVSRWASAQALFGWHR